MREVPSFLPYKRDSCAIFTPLKKGRKRSIYEQGGSVFLSESEFTELSNFQN